MRELEFLSPLSKRYWQCAAAEFHNLRSLLFVSLMAAASIALMALFIPIGENLRVYFTFVFSAVGGLVGGPLMGLAAGAVVDFLGYAVAPTGAYFPGYMLSKMLVWFIFGLLLYRRQVTILRLFIAKALYNFLVNALIGSVWRVMLVGNGYFALLTASLLKNTLLLPIEMVLLVLVMRLMLPIFEGGGVVPRHAGERILPLAKPKIRDINNQSA